MGHAGILEHLCTHNYMSAADRINLEWSFSVHMKHCKNNISRMHLVYNYYLKTRTTLAAGHAPNQVNGIVEASVVVLDIGSSISQEFLIQSLSDGIYRLELNDVACSQGCERLILSIHKNTSEAKRVVEIII